MSKYCPKCGRENVDEARFCSYCAAPFQQIENSVDDKEYPPMREEAQSEKKQPEEEQTQRMELPKTDTPVKKGRKGSKKKKVVFGAVLFILLICVLAMCSKPSVVEINAKFAQDGNRQEGVVLDSNNGDIIVIGTDENGDQVTLSGWEIESPATLKADSVSKVMIKYKDMSTKLEVECSTSELDSIGVTYDGNTEEGTVIDDENEGVKVTAYYKNGTESIVSDWEIAQPVTLEADLTSDVTITYGGMSEDLSVECSTITLKSISASYDGKTTAGTWLSEKNDGIHVKAKYKNGTKEEVSDWKIRKKTRLKAGKTSKVTIEYGDKTCVLEVQCTTMSESQYKEKCQSISYDSLARDPSKYKGELVKFTGEVIQVLEESGIVAMRVNVTNNGYGYYDDTVYVWYLYDEDESKFLEDDIITFYGEYDGLYSYESVLGATITIPEVFAKYIVRN